MKWYYILTIIGTPALIIAIIKCVYALAHKKVGSIKALKLGVQALLRAQMINDYNRWCDKGFAPIYARENFENCWKQYEALGVNGVMCDIHNKFMCLPTEKE